MRASRSGAKRRSARLGAGSAGGTTRAAVDGSSVLRAFAEPAPGAWDHAAALVVLFNKPYGVVTQFSPHPGRRTLQDFISFPNVYPAGRLDWDSEGLLVLTDDGRLQQRITNPRAKLSKTYLVQVEGIPDERALEQLRRGVALNDGPTLPARARRISQPPLWPRDPPIRQRRFLPTAWVEIILSEGRNRQVRRMTAAVGHPTLRLVRWAVGPWTIAGLAPGSYATLACGPNID